MKVFISYNKADKNIAELLAITLVEQGVSVWYDEWNIQVGESLTGGVEEGLDTSDVFVLLWSCNAKKSNWVGTETRAYVKRRVEDKTLRIVPIMLDDTPLPTLVSDYKGFDLNNISDLTQIAGKIVGSQIPEDLAARLQRRLNQLSEEHSHPHDPFPLLVCPLCASKNLKRGSALDYARDEEYYVIECMDCGWGDWTQ